MKHLEIDANVAIRPHPTPTLGNWWQSLWQR